MTSKSTRQRLPATILFLLLLIPANNVTFADDMPAGEIDDVQHLANGIDALIAAHWHAAGVSPVNPASDAEFLRRVWLDIAGKIPPAADVQDFLEESSPDKRRRVVDELLAGPNYIMNFSNFWRSVLLPETETNFQIRFMLPGFDAWLRNRLTEDVRYDDLVREILTTRVQGMNPYDVQNPNPVAFYQAKETKPENLAAATSRMFLGVRIECAQCHDHPFDNWKRKDFWGYAAFFASMQRAPNNNNGLLGQLRELFSRRSLKIPETTETVDATYLDGQSPQTGSSLGLRGTLAGWVTSNENPYFARTAANRVWGHFFGIGIVDPVDDFSENNPPSHPELLDLLARELVAHDFDLKFLMRAVTRSRTYQLTSRRADEVETEVDPSLFARMPLKGLTAEQLYNSLAQATGLPNAFNPNQSRGGDTPRRTFEEAFADSHSAPTERQKSVLQALEMMNGKIVGDATGLERSIALTAIADYPLFDTRQKIESLFLAALSRKPQAGERERFIAYVDSGGAQHDSRQALSDVFWALLNSNEFSVNH